MPTFPFDAGDFTWLAECFAFIAQEILHAWHDSMRNSVKAWNSRSMHESESWQPCLYTTH